MPVERHTRGGGATITGAAIGGFACLALYHAIGMYLKTGMKASRFHTPAAMRSAATQFTGRPYARSQKGLQQAYADLKRIKDEAKTLDEIGEKEIVNRVVGVATADTP